MKVEICKDIKTILIVFDNNTFEFPMNERFKFIDRLKYAQCTKTNNICILPPQEEYCFFLYNDVIEFGIIKEETHYSVTYESKMLGQKFLLSILEREVVEIHKSLAKKLKNYTIISEFTKYLPLCYSGNIIFDCKMKLCKFTEDIQDHLR